MPSQMGFSFPKQSLAKPLLGLEHRLQALFLHLCAANPILLLLLDQSLKICVRQQKIWWSKCQGEAMGPGHLRTPLLLLLFPTLLLLGREQPTNRQPHDGRDSVLVGLLLQFLFLPSRSLVHGLSLTCVGSHQLLVAHLQELEGLLRLALVTSEYAPPKPPVSCVTSTAPGTDHSQSSLATFQNLLPSSHFLEDVRTGSNQRFSIRQQTLVY